MVNAEIIDMIEEIDKNKGEVIAKMAGLARELVKEVAAKFPGGSLEISSMGLEQSSKIMEPNIEIYYLRQKKGFLDLFRVRIHFMRISKPLGIEEVLVKVYGDPKFISPELVVFTKKLVKNISGRLGLKVKEL